MTKEKKFILRLVHHFIASANKEPKQVWYKRQLVKDSGKFELSLKFKSK